MEIGVDSVAGAVAFVLPGYLAMELCRLLLRAKKRDDFERLAYSLFFSLVAYLLAGSATRAIRQHADWQSSTIVSLENWLFVGLLFVSALLLGYGVARVIAWQRLQEWLRARHLDISEHASVWNEIWHCEEGAPWVIVRMKDGSECYGQLRAYTADPDDARREIWLHPVADTADPEQQPEVVPGLSIYVPGDQVISISAYRVEEESG
jgi:hypothetical protein